MLHEQVIAQDVRARYPSLIDKRVVVTGGGSGIGAGLVAGFVAQGANVTFIDILDRESQQLVEGVHDGARHDPRFIHCDLTNVPALEAAMQNISSEMGGIDILVNNAANDDRHSIEDVTLEYWEDRMAVNMRHQFFAAKAVIPAMKAQGHGVIVNLGSISWHLGLEDLPIYQIAKAGIEGMTRALSRELGPHGIRVNTVVPGNVQTPRQMKWYTPEGEREIVDAQCLKGRIQPEDVAALVLFLASDDARMCTAHSYWVDAGWR